MRRKRGPAFGRVGLLCAFIAFCAGGLFVRNALTESNAQEGAAQSSSAPAGGVPFTPGANPFRVAFDGANIWVANYDHNNVTKLRASDGAVQGTFAVGTSPVGVVFDGANIWVANSMSNNVTKLRASDAAVEGTYEVSFGPYGMAFDGTNV